MVKQYHSLEWVEVRADILEWVIPDREGNVKHGRIEIIVNCLNGVVKRYWNLTHVASLYCECKGVGLIWWEADV